MSSYVWFYLLYLNHLANKADFSQKFRLFLRYHTDFHNGYLNKFYQLFLGLKKLRKIKIKKG